jgi:succinate-semialdehyde dehydrogenase/glutarate-semialdehyde dehydrogenase
MYLQLLKNIKKNNPKFHLFPIFGNMIELKDPYTNTIFHKFELDDRAKTRSKIDAAQHAFQEWKKSSFDTRAKVLMNIAGQLRKQKHHLADTITKEMGKPISQARAEVEKCVWVCEFYAKKGTEFLADKIISTNASRSYISYHPYGVILAIMPWNYPLWQVFRFLAPAIMAGNVALLKHAPNTFLSAKNIADVTKKAGLPEVNFQNLFIDVEQVEAIIADPIVNAVTFTGSTTAGSKVAEQAGKNLKRSVLELGGSNALIICKDADIHKAARTCVKARFQNNGQSCIAGKRLFVHEDVQDEFISKLVDEVRQLRVGDPKMEETYISVMAREDLAYDLKKQLDDALEKGAQLIYGGKQDGSYFEPTILIDCDDDMKVMKEETFGPLLPVQAFSVEDEVIKKVNGSRYALGASVFTNNQTITKKMIAELNEPSIFINDLVKSDPRLPFGGYKDSGYGRELAEEGIREFSLIKTVYHK